MDAVLFRPGARTDRIPGQRRPTLEPRRAGHSLAHLVFVEQRRHDLDGFGDVWARLADRLSDEITVTVAGEDLREAPLHLDGLATRARGHVGVGQRMPGQPLDGRKLFCKLVSQAAVASL